MKKISACSWEFENPCPTPNGVQETLMKIVSQGLDQANKVYTGSNAYVNKTPVS